MRLLDLLRRSTDCLEAAGIDEAFADAELLVFHAANMDRIDAYVNNPAVKSSDSARVRRLLQRRLKGEPIQYIVGQIEFLGLTIKVGRGVLIPRPETELLVEEAIKAVMRNKISVASKEKNALRVTQRASQSVLDLCTGSGCIALSLAKEFPDAEVYGTDLSKEALVYAKKNAKANDIKNVTFLQGSLFEPVKGKAYDLITANPPYIRRSELETLQREIRDWEPISALDGGEDGMDFYRTILSSADQFLNPGGSLFLELGYDQAEAVKKVAKRQGFLDLAVINDYAGIGRILAVRR